MGRDLSVFSSEAGGHRFQRIPPTERRGRVHTSTITVATIEVSRFEFRLDPKDVEFSTSHGDGPGGQHMQKTESVVIATYKPTGDKVRIGTSRSQGENKEIALEVLQAKIAKRNQEELNSQINDKRRAQIGAGERGDKIRTYRSQDDRVTDHRTGKTWQLSKWRRGLW